VSKRRTSKTKAEAVARDPVAESIANDEPTEEFPDGSIWFASKMRWFNQYVVDPGVTTTGRGYTIQRTGTEVDIRDMDCLKELRTQVFCRLQERYIEVSPVGVTSM